MTLSFELFIAKRIISGQPDNKNKTKPLVGTSILAIALGLAVMIVSVAILTGFKKEITDKLVGFSSHIQITNLDNNTSFETEPIELNDQLENKLSKIAEVKHFYPYAIKAGIISTQTDLQGIVLKGVNERYDFSFLESFITEGKLITFTDSVPGNEVILSRSLASLLNLQIGDKIPTYFIQIPPVGRPFIVGGIYNTGLEEFDLRYVFCDLRHIQKVNNWNEMQITGYEVVLSSLSSVNTVSDELFDYTVGELASGNSSLDVQSVQEISPGFFDFLKLTDTNVWVILGLMVLVSGFNMISGLLILILNRTNMIGILKAMGANNSSLRKIFLIQASYIIGIGLLLGNLFGILFAILQDGFRIIKLDPSAYFVDAVPVNLDPLHILLINAGAMVITLAMLIIPSGIISKISPDKTIKFD